MRGSAKIANLHDITKFIFRHPEKKPPSHCFRQPSPLYFQQLNLQTFLHI